MTSVGFSASKNTLKQTSPLIFRWFNSFYCSAQMHLRTQSILVAFCIKILNHSLLLRLAPASLTDDDDDDDDDDGDDSRFSFHKKTTEKTGGKK